MRARLFGVHLRVLALTACVLALSGCASDKEPERFKSPRDLAAALGCEYRPFTSVLGPGTEQGACQYAGADLSLTVTARASMTRELAERLAGEPLGKGVTTLVGNGWLIVSRDEGAVRKAQGVVGGAIDRP